MLMIKVKTVLDLSFKVNEEQIHFQQIHFLSDEPTVPSPMTIFTAFKIRGELLYYTYVDDSMFLVIFTPFLLCWISQKKKKKPTSDYLLRLSYNCSTRYLRQKYSNFTFTQIYDSVGLGWDLRIYLSNNFPDDANVPSLRILLWHV